MNKRFAFVVVGVFLVLGSVALVACSDASAQSFTKEQSPSGSISVYSREDGSGTRGAFVELFNVEEQQKGQKVDMTTLSASITNSTAVMMTSVANDSRGIGYISLGSLNDTVKALSIDGTKPSMQNVKNGSYKISRPFNIVTNGALSDVVQDFETYLLSSEGQKVVEDNGYITVNDTPQPYTASGQSGKVVLAGSSSVTPVMEKLAEAYQALNPDASIEVQQSDSTTGVQMAQEKTCDIGMASRELSGDELSTGIKATPIAQDGIALIVGTGAKIDNLTSNQVKAIYTGDVATWEDALA